MKIGILSFHSQQNYGGVLQCWALKKTLESLGHDVVVIDRWLDRRRKDLKGFWGMRDPKRWLSYFQRLLIGHMNLSPFVRALRSMKFVRELGLTPYHFVDWKNAPKDLGLDLIVVGSDQVWNCTYNKPDPYLLEGYTGNLPRVISYAASFGMKAIPEDKMDLYKRGLSRFSAISCRESEGVEICRELGFSATHVVDPTLLADASCWNKLIKASHRHSSLITHTSSLRAQARTLVCYFLDVDIASALPHLEAFAASQDCRVQILTRTPVWYKTQRVEICSGYGPKEFVNAFASANWTLTDSFHAVMFSSIFEKNLRFVKPEKEFRLAMFARIEEFAAKNINGAVFVDSVQPALNSFAKGETISYNREEIDKRRAASLDWLKKTIIEKEAR